LTTYPDGSAILALFNLAPAAAEIKLSWREIDALRDTRLADAPPATLHDLITNTEVPVPPDGPAFSLDPHASRIFRIQPRK
jgi:hypothetical protein